VLGSAIVRGAATEILDVAHYLPLGFADWFHAGDGPTASARKRVLFVDDSAFFRNMLAPVLQAAGYDVAVAPAAKDALGMLERNARFDAIVTDIEMPEMDGYEFAEAIGANARLSHIPVIALSSTLTGAAVAKGERLGMHAYVAKFDRRGLLQALKTVSSEMQEAA